MTEVQRGQEPREESADTDLASAVRYDTAACFNLVGADRLARLQTPQRYPDHAASDRFRNAFFQESIAKLSKVACALDLGTGQGTWAVRLSEHADEVLAADFGADILAVARQITGERRNVTLLRADAERTGLNDGSFDLVTHMSVLMYLPDQEAGLREVFRLLTPGGTMILEVPNAQSLTYRAYDRRQHVRRLPLHSRPTFVRLDDLERMLARCGFEVRGIAMSWSVADWLIGRVAGLGRRRRWLGHLLPLAGLYYASTFSITRILGRLRLLHPFFREFHVVAVKPASARASSAVGEP